jgi:hypothetical protein
LNRRLSAMPVASGSVTSTAAATSTATTAAATFSEGSRRVAVGDQPECHDQCNRRNSYKPAHSCNSMMYSGHRPAHKQVRAAREKSYFKDHPSKHIGHTERMSNVDMGAKNVRANSNSTTSRANARRRTAQNNRRWASSAAAVSGMVRPRWS